MPIRFLAPVLLVGGPRPRPPSRLRPDVAPADWPWWRGPTLDGTSRDRAGPDQVERDRERRLEDARPRPGPLQPGPVGRPGVPDHRRRGQADPAGPGLRPQDRQGRCGTPSPTPAGSTRSTRRTPTPRPPRPATASGSTPCSSTRGRCTSPPPTWTARSSGRQRAGPYASQHGNGSSPVLYKKTVIVVADSLKGSFLAALDRATGDVVWKIDRPVTGRNGSYESPVVATIAGQPQLIVQGTRVTTATTRTPARCCGRATARPR